MSPLKGDRTKFDQPRLCKYYTSKVCSHLV